MSSLKIICPLCVPVGKKNYSLNLNVYRNTHFRVLAVAKKNYKLLIKTPRGIKLDKVRLIYTLYPKTKRKMDISNVCSIVDKFVCDVLVDRGIIEDDNMEVVKEITYKIGEIDKKEPRVELEVISILQ